MIFRTLLLLIIALVWNGCGDAIGGMALRVSPKLTAVDFTADRIFQPYVQAAIDVGHSRGWRAHESMVSTSQSIVRVGFLEMNVVRGSEYLLDFEISRMSAEQGMSARIIGGVTAPAAAINAFESDIKAEFRRLGLADIVWTPATINFRG